MKTSLVLSSYNGRDYIEDQLDSLRRQTKVLDEVLISDDCSADGTPEVVSSYIEEHALSNWRLAVNSENKGWKRNFHDLLYKTSGDLIFLCDQDDVWLPTKVSEMADLMEINPLIDVLACDVEPFYEEGSKHVPNVGKGTENGTLKMQRLDARAIYVLRPGCAYCVRKSFLDEIGSYWDENWAHDALLWELAQVKGSLAIYDKRLVKFRRHNGNASARKRMNRGDRMRDIEHLIERVSLMRRFGVDRGTLNPMDRQHLDDIDSWLNDRLILLEKISLQAFSNVFAGREHYSTWKGLFVDLAFAFRKEMII